MEQLEEPKYFHEPLSEVHRSLHMVKNSFYSFLKVLYINVNHFLGSDAQLIKTHLISMVLIQVLYAAILSLNLHPHINDSWASCCIQLSYKTNNNRSSDKSVKIRNVVTMYVKAA
jgi:hypothetical protein